jgi:hypothetical protein
LAAVRVVAMAVPPCAFTIWIAARTTEELVLEAKNLRAAKAVKSDGSKHGRSSHRQGFLRPQA